MTVEPSTRGRPRAFNTDKVLAHAVDLFWCLGYHGTTTRVLETELGISQSSLYNAFTSKDHLFDQVLERYQNQLNATVLAKLDRPDPDRESILEFFTALVAWIQNKDHPGCLVLNFSVESEEGGKLVTNYRKQLRKLLRPALRTFTTDEDDVEARTELLVLAALGLNISARSGANRAELRRLGNGIKRQVATW